MVALRWSLSGSVQLRVIMGTPATRVEKMMYTRVGHTLELYHSYSAAKEEKNHVYFSVNLKTFWKETLNGWVVTIQNAV